MPSFVQIGVVERDTNLLRRVTACSVIQRWWLAATQRRRLAISAALMTAHAHRAHALLAEFADGLSTAVRSFMARMLTECAARERDSRRDMLLDVSCERSQISERFTIEWSNVVLFSTPGETSTTRSRPGLEGEEVRERCFLNAATAMDRTFSIAKQAVSEWRQVHRLLTGELQQRTRLQQQQHADVLQILSAVRVTLIVKVTLHEAM